MGSDKQGPAGNAEGDGEDLKLGLVIGVPAAVLFIMIIVTLIVLWKLNKLKCCCRSRSKTKKEDQARREERKKSIIIIAPSGKKGAELYIARHYYEAEDENQLSLETGRIVEVQEKLDNGWWRGVTGDNEGWFPATFVKKIDVSDPNCSLQRSMASTISTPDNARHPPPPTGKPPVGELTSTNVDIYVNSGFEIDNTGARDPDVSKSAVNKPDMGNSEESSTKEDTISGNGGELKKCSFDKNIDIKLASMKKEDIEGYLNEIFSVEDETTPETQRKNKLRISKHSRDAAYQEGNKKRLKDERNESLLQEQLQTTQERSIAASKKGHSRKVKSSPLINPEHYMISSSESLFSASSCTESADTTDEQKALSQAKEEMVDRVYDEPDNGQANIKPDANRGAPDGSSLVGILPDGHKELSLEQTFLNDENLDRNEDDINSEIDLYEKVSNNIILRKNEDSHLKSAITANRPVYIAMYPFIPTEPNQLTLASNDVVLSLGQEENGWMKGEKKSTGETGWFPVSYVREGKQLSGSDVFSEESENFDSEGDFEDEDMTGLEYRAIYPFTAQQEGDLTFAEGDIIIVIKSLDNGWWRGCLGNQEGWFPGTYVEPIPQTPSSASVYEDIESPLKVAPLVRSTAPLSRDLVSTSECESLTTGNDALLLFKKDAVCAGNKQAQKSREQSKIQKQNDAVISSLNTKFKPHVPRRFVKPKLVFLPKQRKRNLKPVCKPSRPPPPVPKDDDGRVEGMPAEQPLDADYSMQQAPSHTSVSEGKRKTVPRPKEPPPPAPHMMPNVHIYDDVEPGLSQTASDIHSTGLLPSEQEELTEQREQSKFYSRLELKNSLPRVHTSARLEQSEKVKLTESSGSVPESSSSLNNCALDNSSTSSTKAETGVPVESFSAIMGLFERIANKGSHSEDIIQNNSSSDSVSLMLKPAIPPKPNKLDFRRTRSESDLLSLNTTFLMSSSEAGIQERKTPPKSAYSDAVASDKDASVVDGTKHTTAKPSLPPRPKIPRLRSQSLGSLMLVKSIEKSLVVTEINEKEKVKETSIGTVKEDTGGKPEKPPLPAVILNGKIIKEKISSTTSVGTNKVLSGSTVFSSKLVDQPTLKREPSKTTTAENNFQTKFGSGILKDPSECPPRPVQPPLVTCTTQVHNTAINKVANTNPVGPKTKMDDPDLIKDDNSHDSSGLQAPPLSGSSPPDLVISGSARSEVSDITLKSAGQSTGDSKLPQQVSPLEEKPATSQVNISTSSLRFFTPVGFSRSAGVAGLSSTRILKPFSSTTAISSEKPGIDTDGQKSVNSSNNSTVSQPNRFSSITNKDQVSTSNQSEKPLHSPSSSLQFYTPIGFRSQQKRMEVDNVSKNHSQTYISSSEQNLAAQPSVEEAEKYGSTGSLNYPSSKQYRPYASIEIRPTEKRMLTSPKPFIPSRWSAYHGLQKVKVPLAMVDIDIDDCNKTAYDSKEQKNSETPATSAKSPDMPIAQSDLESDV